MENGNQPKLQMHDYIQLSFNDSSTIHTVQVTEVKETNRVDDNENPIFLIKFKKATAAETRLLRVTFIYSDHPYKLLDHKEQQEDFVDTSSWGKGDPSEIGTEIYKYFPQYGWFQGDIIDVLINPDTNAVVYLAKYKDGDSETLSAPDFADVKSYAKMDPRPQAPLVVFLAQLANSRTIQGGDPKGIYHVVIFTIFFL